MRPVRKADRMGAGLDPGGDQAAKRRDPVGGYRRPSSLPVAIQYDETSDCDGRPDMDRIWRPALELDATGGGRWLRLIGDEIELSAVIEMLSRPRGDRIRDDLLGIEGAVIGQHGLGRVRLCPNDGGDRRPASADPGRR